MNTYRALVAMNRVKRIIIAAVVAAIGIAAPSATAQIRIQQPKIGDQGFAGASTIVIFDVEPGLAAMDAVTDGQDLQTRFWLINDLGHVFFGPFSSTVTDSAGNAPQYENAVGNTDLRIDLSAITFLLALQNPMVRRIQIELRTVDNDDAVFIRAPLDAMDPSADETLIKNIDTPMITHALLDDAADTLYLVFSESVTNGAMDNDPNQTVLATIDGTDLQFRADSSFDGSEASPVGLSAPAFFGADGTAIRFDVAMTTDIGPGVWIRPNFDDSEPPAAMHDFFDFTRNRAGADAVMITQLQDLAPVSAEWTASVPAGAGAVAEAIRFTWNNPLDSGSLGDAAFYNALVRNGMPSDITVTSVAVDPNNASVIILGVDASGADDVSPDGLGTVGGEEFSFSLDSMSGAPPTDIFSQTFSGAATVNIGDGIAPSLVDLPRTLDTNGDGRINAFGLVFDQPIDPKNADESVFRLRLLNGADVHPLNVFKANLTSDRITDPQHPANIETTNPGGQRLFDIAGFDRTSSDPNGSRLEQNNILVIMFDPDDVVDAADGFLTGAPGTGDVGWASIRVGFSSFQAVQTGVTDAAGNTWQDHLPFTTVSVDGAPPVLVETWFLTGDNVDGMGNQRISEQDGEVHDQADNNVAQLIFSEEVFDDMVDPARFRFGPAATDSFQPGDFDGVTGPGFNIVQFTDLSQQGFAPGDDFHVLGDNGVLDISGNPFPGTPPEEPLTALNRTSPYIPLVVDFTGQIVHAAHLIDTSSPPNSMADRLDLLFTTKIDPDTLTAQNFRVEGVTPLGVTVVGARAQLDLPQSAFHIDDVLTVEYRGASDLDPVADLFGNSVSRVDDHFFAQAGTNPCLGDLNGDGHVNAQDLANLLGSWGVCPTLPDPCAADINNDGIVNAKDLALMLESWGDCH